jgi:hypothetical protein
MKDFIDLKGASGAHYRFRLWPEGSPHLPTGGNYVYLREEENAGFTVLVVGETNDLSKARADWPKATRRGATHVFTRLNVSRAIRNAEHQDILAQYATARAKEAAGADRRPDVSQADRI